MQYITVVKILDIANFLKQVEAEALPGWDAQRLMSPSYRGHYSMEKILELKPRLGSVAIILYEKEEQLFFVLTQRHDYDGAHSGQISFPGGKNEMDEDLLATAIRESKEEIGVQLFEHQHCLSLSPIFIPPSHFLVHPFIFYCASDMQFLRDEFEVKEILEIPLHLLLDDQFKTKSDINVRGSLLKGVPSYVFGDKMVWGATAIILSELEMILKKYFK